MADSFDPYHKWLGISPKDQPANHYRLLGIELFEADADVIEGAADQRMSHVRTFQAGQNSALSQRLLNELSAAKLCLLTPQKKADYDRQLRERMASVDNSLRAPMAAPAQQRAALPIATVLPQAAPRPATPAAPVIIAGNQDLGASTYRPHRKTPLWRQPALLGTAGALVLFAAIAYFLARSGKLPTEVATPNSKVTGNRTAENHTDTKPLETTARSPAITTPPMPPSSNQPPSVAVVPPTIVEPPASGMPEVAPPKKEPSALLVLGESGSPIDVLAAINLDRDRLHGDWQYDGQTLISPSNEHGVMEVQLPALVPADYQVDAVAQRESGDDCLSFTFPVAGTYGTLCIDGGKGTLSGLQMIDDKDFTSNETTREARVFADGQPHSINLRVQKNHVRLFCDGKPLVDWSGDVSRLKASEEPPYRDRIYLGHWHSRYRLTKIKLRRLNSETTDEPPPILAGAPVDLLKQIDVKRDAIAGDWQVVDGALVSPDAPFARLLLPAPPAPEYQVTLEGERIGGGFGLALVAVVDGRQTAVEIDGFNGHFTGLTALDGKNCNENETARQGRLLVDGKPFKAVYTVRRNSIKLSFDDRSVIDWHGDPSRLSMIDGYKLSDAARLALGEFRTVCRISKLEIAPLAAAPLAPAPSALAGGAIDLLKQVDVAKDAVEGDWKRTDEALISPSKSGARLMLPYEPSGDYELTVVAERLAGSDSFVLGVVVGGRQVAMTLDGYGGETAGLADLDGHDGATNEATRRGRHLPPGKPHTIVCAVSTGKLRVTCDGKEALAWSGDASRLSNDVFWSVPNAQRLFLGAWESEFKYTRIEVKPLRRSADLAASQRKGSPARMDGESPNNLQPPQRQFSDLASDGGGSEKRAAVPDDESLKKARQEMQKSFSGSMKAARTPDLKRSLSQEMAEKASFEEKGGAYAYVLFNHAIDLAEATGDLELAWKIIDQLAQSFDVDGMDLRNRSLVGAGKTAKTPERAWELGDAACRLMLAALKAGDADAVRKAGKQAEIFAKRTKDKSVQKLVAAHADDAAKLAGEIGSVEEARETLKTMPLDAHANQVVGHYELCATGDWNAALPKLARSDDAEWRKLAQSEQSLGDVADPAKQLSTADGWWSLAEEAPWPGKHYLQMRAGKRYSAAHRSLVDVGRVRAADRLKALLAIDDGLPNWELFNWRGFQTGQPTGDVVRVESGRSLETAVEYDGAIDVILVARATGTKIRLHSHSWSWNWDFVVEPNRWHTLRYTITPFLRTAMLDGLLVHTDGSKTARRLNSAPVYISAFNDEIIEVKKFIVRGL